MRETLQYPRQVNIRLTNDQAEALEEIAAEEEMTISSLIRRTLIRSFFMPRGGRNSPPVTTPATRFGEFQDAPPSSGRVDGT